MRSGHSLAFQQFEDVLSEVQISAIKPDHPKIKELLEASTLEPASKVVTPFQMEWAAESDWEPDDPSEVSSGNCILLPVPTSDTEGHLVLSLIHI